MGDRSACRARGSAWSPCDLRRILSSPVARCGVLLINQERRCKRYVCSGGCVSADKGRLGAHILGKARIDELIPINCHPICSPNIYLILSHYILRARGLTTRSRARPARPFHYAQAPEEAARLTDRRQAGQVAGCTHPTIPRCKHGHSRSQER